MAPSKPIQKNIIGTLNKSWILQHSLPLKNCSNQNVWCNSATPQAMFDSQFFHTLSSWRNNNDDRVTVHKTPPFSKHELHVYARQSDIFHLSSSIAFLIKRDEIHVKNKEKPTFLILKVNYILRTALSESPVTLLKFEHLSNQRTKTTLWSVRDNALNDLIGTLT